MDKPRKIITAYDTAIDFARATVLDSKSGKVPLAEYISAREYSVIEPFLLPAEMPTIFNIQILSRELVRRIARFSTNEYSNHEVAFQYGVVSVENHVDDEGRLIQNWKPGGVANGAPYITDDELNLFSVAQVNEIGAVIYQLSFLERKTHSKLHLPRTSRELLEAMTAL